MTHPYLIVGVTGRALAMSAGRGGYDVVVLDYFADRDTRAAARAARAVTRPGGFSFDRAALLAAAAELAPPARCAGLVTGAGFEARPRLLARLARDRRLCGNSPEIVAAVKDPRRLFPLLDRLGIRHPEVRYTPPDDPDGWLRKESGGAGGTHVRPATRRPPGKRGYFQRFTGGRTLSALFLADGHRAALVGINEQWTSGSEARPYLYGGAVGQVILEADLLGTIVARLDALVRETGLVGLNGVDFVLAGNEWLVLEVNPRPTATLELYDADYPRGLFAAHLRASTGELPAAPPRSTVSRAHAIVTAPGSWGVERTFEFPEWCRDVPVVGTELSPGDPVCTVLAEGADCDSARSLVQERRRSLTGAIAQATGATVPT